MSRGSRTTSRRTTGLLVAAAFALISAGVVIFIAFASRSGPQAPAVPANVVDIGKAPDAAADGTIQQTGASRVQFADKQDASRLASELSYDSLDPVGQGYYTLAQPRAWIYMRDGRTLHIRADTGRVKMPSRNSQPESGEFRGKVVVRMYAPPATASAAATPINPETDTPVLLAVTESMNFDSVLMELQTSDPLTISTKQILFNGTGMLVRFNQVQERIELLRTTGKFIRYNPTLKDENKAQIASSKPKHTSSSGAGPGPGGAGEGGPPVSSGTSSAAPATTLVPPTPPRETLYRALFSDDLTVTETTRTLAADTLEVFARTLDNRLPENAFGIWPESTGPGGTGAPPVVESGGKAKGSPATAHAAPASPSSPSTPNPYPPLFISAKDHDIVLTWSGPLVLTPILADPPIELSRGNHFAARFSADKPGAQSVVLLTDSETSARGQCAQIEYAATTRTLAFLSGPAAPMVTLDAPNSGALEVPNFKIDLGSGISQVAGAGRITAVEQKSKPTTATDPANPAASSTPAPPPRQITWSDQADFNFRTERGRLTAALDTAAFTGKVLAKDQVSMIAGDFLRAKFIPAGRQLTAIKHVHVEGNVVGVAGTRSDLSATRDLPPVDPYLSSDTLDVEFMVAKSDPNQTEPAHALAVGNTKAATRDAWITAERLEATLGHDKRDNFTATDLIATNSVHFERADGVVARADVLRANPLTRSADLTGQVVALSRDNSTIVGTQMHLAEIESATGGVGSGTLRVHGPGSFEHTQSDAANPDPTRVTATWTRSLTFDNASGLIEADGDTTVIAASKLATQTAKSNRLQLFLTPAGETSPSTSTSAPADPTLAVSNDRRFLKAEVIGDGGTNATIEVRRYSAPPSTTSERILDQVMFIEGPRIIADDVAGTISVPAAGRAIVRDQRTAPATPTTSAAEPTLANAATPAPSPLHTTSRGTSQFVWAESMLFTRSTGLLSMRKDVELVHLPLGSEQAIRLVAMQLDAHFNIHASGPDNAPKTADLVRAEAIGAVYAEFAQQKLLADRFNYDALNSTAEAIADDGNRVTLYDEKKGPIVARKLFWDLKNDRIEITEPAPVTTIR